MKITIYQPKNPTFRVDESIEHYYKEDFDNVYEFEMNEFDSDSIHFNKLLDFVFELLNNGQKPANYKGHSLSVGDIVEIATEPNEQGCFGTYAYICENIGWKNVMLYDQYQEEGITK